MVAIPQATFGRQLTFKDRALNQELDRLYAAIQQKNFDERNVDVKSLGAAIARSNIAHPTMKVYERLDLTGWIRCVRPTTSSALAYTYVSGDVQPRFQLLASGIHRWGPGDTVYDTILYRNSSADLETDSDFVATGGYRQTLDGWIKTGISPPLSATIMERFDSAGADSEFRNITMIRPGSVTGVALTRTDGDLTAGQISVEVYVAGAGTGLTATLTSGRVATTTQDKDLDTFTAGQNIALYVTVAAGTNGTPDVRATLEIET